MKVYLLFLFVALSLQNVNAQIAEHYSGDFMNFKSFTSDDSKREKFHSHSKNLNNEKKYKDFAENYKTMISIGSGFNWNSGNRNNFIFSFDFIPKLSRNFFLDFKLDGIKEGLTYNTLLNIIPEYKLYLAEDSKFAGYFGIGPALFFSPKGHPGVDASITTQIKFEYSLKTFFINTELRKPVYFYEDSGHIDFILSINFGIKI